MFEPLVSVKAPQRQFGVLLWCDEVVLAAWGDRLFREREREREKIFFLPRSKLFYSLSNNSDNLKNFCGFCLFFQFVQNPSASVWHSIDELLQSSYCWEFIFPYELTRLRTQMSLPLLWELEQLQDIFRAVNLDGCPNPMPCFFTNGIVCRDRTRNTSLVFQGKKRWVYSPLAPRATGYMAVQSGQMHLALMEVTAESFLALLFSFSSVMECHGIPSGERQGMEHLVLYLSCWRDQSI